jgi:hypothetical protein
LSLLVVVGTTIAVFLAWRPLRHLGREIQVERARELFRLQRERLEPQFLRAAAATGKPRGMRWQECVFEGNVEFARDRVTRQLIALAPVTIRFEAVEGGEMEGVAEVARLKSATAVFYFQAGQWLTAGKALFNHNPGDALRRYRAQYEPVASGVHPPAH